MSVERQSLQKVKENILKFSRGGVEQTQGMTTATGRSKVPWGSLI